MSKNEIMEKIKGKLIVSCQALEDEPLHSSYIMGRMAYAAYEGGAAGIRANSVQDIKEIKIHLEEKFPEDLSVWYLDDGEEIQVLMGLDLLECLMRKDLCDIRLLPVQIVEERVYG